MKFRNSTFYTLHSQLPRGDGPSALPDPRFVAKAGATNRVTILIGKAYTVTCDMPVACVGQSSYEIEVYKDQGSPTEMYIRWPVSIEAVSMRSGASFSKSAVIFEDRYENTPGVWVERQSTQTELHCVAHGGPNGGHVRLEIVGEEKLQRVSGIWRIQVQ